MRSVKAFAIYGKVTSKTGNHLHFRLLIAPPHRGKEAAPQRETREPKMLSAVRVPCAARSH
jgi:hypothetical protein